MDHSSATSQSHTGFRGIKVAIHKANLCIEHRQLAYELYLTKDEIQAFYNKSRIHRESVSRSSIILKNNAFS